MKNATKIRKVLGIPAIACLFVLAACTTTEPPFPYETKAEPCCGAVKKADIAKTSASEKAVLAQSVPPAQAQTVPAKEKKIKKNCAKKDVKPEAVKKKPEVKAEVIPAAVPPVVAPTPQPEKPPVATVAEPVVVAEAVVSVSEPVVVEDKKDVAKEMADEKAKVQAELDALKAEKEKLEAEKEKAKQQIAAKKCDEIKDWVAAEGTTLRGLLTEWGNQSGWRVVWNMDRDYTLEAGAVFRGRFVDVSSALLRSFARARPAPKGTFYKGNKVLVISTREDENAE